MSGIDFPYGRCPLKHFVRTDAWLPLSKRHLQAIRQGRKPKHTRRLRYFTFCAVGAIDVLMLDVTKVIRWSSNRQFDTVFFFTRSDEAIGETRKNIPGAIGFPGSFVDVILTPDAGEDLGLGLTGLESPQDLPDTRKTREEMLRLRTRRDFRRSFPFDVINLDLEGYLFKPAEKIPGDLINALRKVFEWQQRPLVIPGRPEERLETFGLMFTTKLGPRSLSREFLGMLRDGLEQNLNDDAELRQSLVRRTGVEQIATLLEGNFEAFFKLAAPKIIVQALMETDWYVDPAHGITLYEFERRPEGAEAYRMLHLVMDVRRQDPPRDARPPGLLIAPTARQAYPQVVRDLFERPEKVVTLDTVDVPAMERNLDLIERRRKKYARES